MRASILAVLLLSTIGCAVPRADTEDEGGSAQGVAAVESTPVITFSGDFREEASGTLHAGASVDVVYDPARLGGCRGEEGGRPQWAITAWARVDGGTPTGLPIAGLMGPAGNRVTFSLPSAGDLEIWFENTNKYGCRAFDSEYGRNYHFRVEPREGAPGWMGNAAVVISRATCDGGACDGDRHALDGFRLDTWARQRALVAGAYFDVWKQGVTDFDNPDLWRRLDVRVHFRFVDADSAAAPGAGAEAWSWAYVSFEKRVGNDARYVVPLRSIDPLGGRTRTSKADCPPSLSITEDGQYVQTDVELYFTVNGEELRPASGAYRGTFLDYRDLYSVCF